MIIQLVTILMIILNHQLITVRTSSGIRAFDNFGNYFARVASDIELASINAGNSVAVDLRYDDKLPEDSFAVIQVAILYTAISGERRVRCHNISLPVTTTVADLFRAACCDTLMNLLLRQSKLFSFYTLLISN